VTTKIEWTDETWNPTTGCTKISAGCAHCYIERTPPFRIEKRRFERGTGEHAIGTTTGVTLHPDRLSTPLHWRKPRRVFVNSLSDLFHDDVPTAFIHDIFAVMAASSAHTFQILTKRPARMASVLNSEYFPAGFRQDYGEFEWPLPNVWLGVSVEDQEAANLRIPKLLETPAAVRFLSCEPLLGPVDLRLPEVYRDIDGNLDAGRRRFEWVIVGGESGPGARPMHPDWARSLCGQCVAAGVPFFFKQWGEWSPVKPSPYYQATKNRMSHESFTWTPEGKQYSPTDPDGWWGSTTVYRVGKKNAGRVLDGRTWDEFPELVRA